MVTWRCTAAVWLRRVIAKGSTQTPHFFANGSRLASVVASKSSVLSPAWMRPVRRKRVRVRRSLVTPRRVMVSPRPRIEDTAGAIEDTIRAGYVRYAGLSESGAESVRKTNAVTPIRVSNVGERQRNGGRRSGRVPPLSARARRGCEHPIAEAFLSDGDLSFESCPVHRARAQCRPVAWHTARCESQWTARGWFADVAHIARASGRSTHVRANRCGSGLRVRDDDRATHCWGFNGDGQLGDGTLFDRALPALVRYSKP
jgi:hypothetical protein